jgi:hypothetical protein
MSSPAAKLLSVVVTRDTDTRREPFDPHAASHCCTMVAKPKPTSRVLPFRRPSKTFILTLGKDPAETYTATVLTGTYTQNRAPIHKLELANSISLGIMRLADKMRIHYFTAQLEIRDCGSL